MPNPDLRRAAAIPRQHPDYSRFPPNARRERSRFRRVLTTRTIYAAKEAGK